jgi:hypothetical protein
MGARSRAPFSFPAAGPGEQIAAIRRYTNIFRHKSDGNRICRRSTRTDVTVDQKTAGKIE